jgi:hypothetical protein
LSIMSLPRLTADKCRLKQQHLNSMTCIASRDETG